MLTAEHNSNSFADVARLSNRELLEVHRSKSRSTTQKLVTDILRFDYLTRSQSLRGCRRVSIKRYTMGRLPSLLLFLPLTKVKKKSKEIRKRQTAC
jgi:hypothetical protein